MTWLETIAALGSLHHARARVIDRFLATLDPNLVDALRRSPLSPDDFRHKGRLGQAWPSLDETFGQGAPLKACILPVIDAPRRVEGRLRKHLPPRPDGRQWTSELKVVMQRERMRPFLPEVSTDLVNLCVPGFH